LGSNNISSIESGAFSGLTNLTELDLHNNTSMTDLNLEGAGFSSLTRFDVGGNTSITRVSLKNAVLNQTSLAALLDGGSPLRIGIGELSGITELDLSGLDFSQVSDMSVIDEMDDLEKLLLAGATNLGDDQVLARISGLDSLNWLDVTGLWNTFDVETQNSLSSWDAVEGNTLVPEPATLTLLALGGLGLLRRRKRRNCK